MTIAADAPMRRVGKRTTSSLLDGMMWKQFPNSK